MDQAVARTSSPDVRRAPRRHLGWRLGIVAVLLLAAIVAALVVLNRGSPIRYTTMPVTRGAVTRSVTATGTVNPVLTIIVGTYVSGVIQQLFCDYNTQVKQGQVCAKIDPRPFQATLDQYSGQLARDQGLLAKDRADLARYQKLASQDSIARQQAEDQQYTVQQDEGTVKLDEGLVEGAKLNLGYTDIVSPVDGTVVSRNVTQGQTVAATFQTPTLFLIATDLTKMEVDTNVSESDIGTIKQGNPARFTVDAFPNRAFRAAVGQVRQSPQTVQNVVTYDVVVNVDNADLALMPGMTASVQIITDERDNALRVSDQALAYRPAGAEAAKCRVWVLRDGRPVPLQLGCGLDDDSNTEVLQGELREGDQVIVSEQHETSRASVPLPRL